MAVAMRVLPEYSLLDHSPDEPAVLAGPPGRMKGRVRLHNSGDQRAVVRHAMLRNLPASHLRGSRAKVQLSGAATLVAIVPPGQRASVPLRASIDPYTPPGTYMAEILVGEHAYPVRLEVTEDISLSATPSTILVENEPGGRAKRRVVYENTGNVPVTVGRLGALPLDEQLAECRTMRGMLADFGDKAETFDQWLTAYLRSGKKQLEKSGLLWVDAEKGPVTIQPGETAAVDLMIRMPDTLERSTRYYAIGFVYDVDLKFVIGPTGATPTAAPHRKAQPRRRRGEANELPPAQ